MNESTPWYVAVGDTSVGPVPAELVIRGIQQHKVPPEAFVCEAGSAAWIPLASVGEFHAAVVQSYPPPPPGSENAQFWLARGFRFPQPAALPRLDDPLYAARPTPALHAPPAPISAGAALKRTLPPVTPPPRRSVPSLASPSSQIPPAPASPPRWSASPSQTGALPVVTPPPRRSAPPPQLGALPAVAPRPAKHTLPPPSPPPRRSPIPPLPPPPASSPRRMARSAAAPVEATPVEATPVALLAETPTPPPSVVSAPRASASDIVVDLDIEDVFPSPPVDWAKPFTSYFLVGEDVSLPDEEALLASLSRVPRETFQQDEALWNLALCMAYSSDEVAEAAARTFWEVVEAQGNLDRLAWMDRTLLGSGFVPSGIPAEAGRRAHERLESVRPPALSQHPPPADF